MLKLFSSRKQALPSNVVYFFGVTTLFTVASFVIQKTTQGSDIPEIILICVFVISMPFLQFLILPRIVNYNDGVVSVRPFTSMEAIFCFFVYLCIAVFLYSMIATYSIEDDKVTIPIFIASLFYCLVSSILNYRTQNISVNGFVFSSRIDEENIKEIIQRVIRSDIFMSTLQSALPAAQGGEAASHLPFIISSLNEKRNNFKRSSQIFFISLIFFTSIFTALLTFFGFIIMDEAQTKAGRSIVEIKEKADSIDELMGISSGDYKNKLILFFSRLHEIVRKINVSVGEGYDEEKIESQDIVDFSGKTIPEIITLIDDRLLEINVASSRNNMSEDIIKEAKEFNEEFSDLKKTSVEYYRDLSQQKSQLKDLVGRATSLENSEENRVYELIKRISIGFIVGSFFFAIIRYLSQQYGMHLAKYEESHQDEIQLRKFYLGYDLTRSDATKQIDLMRHWLSPLGDKVSVKDSINNSQSSLSDVDKKIISEILEILKKRI